MAQRKAHKPSSSETNPYLAQLVRSFKKSLVTVFIFSFFLNLLALTVPIYLLQIYSKVLPNQSTDTLIILTCIALIALVTFGLLDSVRRKILSQLGSKFDHHLSEHLLSSALTKSATTTNSSVNIMRDLSRIREFLSSSTILPLLDIPWTPMFIFILFLLHPLLGFVGVFGVVLLVSLGIYNEYRTRKGINKASNQSRDLIDNARALIKNSDVIKAMGMHDNVLNLWRNSNAEFLSQNFETNKTNRIMQSISKQASLVLIIVVIFTAAWLIMQQELTAGATIASVLLLRRAISPIQQAIRSWKQVIRARESYSKVSDYLNSSATLETTRDMPPPAGVLKARKATFRRRGEAKPVFHRVNIDVRPGKITSLIGPTAAGKSTLLKALTGVLPLNSGSILIGGYDMQNWSSEQLGIDIGYLPQEVGLMPATVRDNISRLVDQPIEAVISAAKLAGAHEMIQKLPDGYETQIDEDGKNLSGGQKQKLGLARALFGYPGYVFLDEPDANLDPEGRSELRHSLAQLRQHNVAVILTTHRPSMVNLADHVYVLENGGVTERKVPDKNISEIEPPPVPPPLPSASDTTQQIPSRY